MKNSIYIQAEKFLRERRENRRWRVFVSCLAVLTVCGIAWVLSRTGQAFIGSKDILDCKYEVHEHSEDCYMDGKLACGKVEYVLHTHDDACYDADEELVCLLPEETGHEHDETCFDTTEILICELEENKTVSGTESSGTETNGSDTSETGTDTIDTSETETGTTEAGETELICGKEKHIHDDSCYGTGETFLNCGMEEGEGGHSHSAGCYTESVMTVLGCSSADEEHSHGEECYKEIVEETLICGQSESEGHRHSDSCYETAEGGFTCTKEEHVHTDGCYGITEVSGEAEQNPDKTPDESETAAGTENKENNASGHIHDEDCYQIVRALTCGEEGIHTHGDECYRNGELICEAPEVETLEEHVHGSECFESIETKEYTLTYDDENILVTVSFKSAVDIPGDVKLDVEVLTEESGSEDYEKYLAQLEETEGVLADEETLAMLLQIGLHTDDEIIMTEDIEDTVSITVEFLNDNIYAEEDDVKAACLTENGIEIITGTDSAIAFETEGFPDLAFIALGEEGKAHTLIYEGEDYIVTVTLDEDTDIPEDAQLMVEEITKENAQEHYEDRFAQLEADGIVDEEEIIALLLNMWISVDGEEIALDETADVTIQFLNNEIYFEEDAVKAAHFTGDGVELLAATDIDEENSTTFKVDELAEFAFITEDVRTLTYEGDGFIVTVRFKEAANIPADAELFAERITRESDPEHFAERKEELREHVEDKYVAVGLLLNIGFYVDDKEIEPEDTVDVKIQVLDRKVLELEEESSPKVAHFAEEGMEILEDADVVEDEEDSLSTAFQLDSFSDVMVFAETDGIKDEWQFRDYMEAAKDGDIVKLGANLTFDGNKLEYTGDNWQALDYVGGRKIVVKLDAPKTDTKAVTKTVTLDLNGYTIWIDDESMTLVDICNGAALVVKDSRGASSQYSIQYKRTTASGTDKDDTEILTAQGGAIVGTGSAYIEGDKYVNKPGNKAAVFTMWFGELTIEDGIIAGNGNRAVQMKGGTLNLKGGFLLNNSARDLFSKNADGKYEITDEAAGLFGSYGYAIGGAVMCEPAFENDVKYGGTINLSGTIISGNMAIEGGGIFANDGSTVKISGGYITHNSSHFGAWGTGGGGIRVRDSELTMTGGQITGNTTRGGGGGICGGGNSKVTLEGGFISSNATEEAYGEGGGVGMYDTSFLTLGNASDYGTLYITNNKSNTTIDWGGGGVFISQSTTARFYNTIITGNYAEGFGGGLAGCATGRIYVLGENGAAIYGNSANGNAYSGKNSTKHEDKVYTDPNVNPVFWYKDSNGKPLFQDYFSVLYSSLDSKMLGGGAENWVGSIDGNSVSTDASSGDLSSSYVVGLTANPTSGDITKATSLGKVFITGNTATTHGGGIMCNGVLIIGAEGAIEINSALELTATKRLEDENGDKIDEMQPGQFSFGVYTDERCTNLVATGTNDKNGNITFDKFLTFDLQRDLASDNKPTPTVESNDHSTSYSYFFYIKEENVSQNSDNIGIKMDDTLYRLTVRVQSVYKGEEYGIKRYVDDIIGISFEKKDSNGDWSYLHKDQNIHTGYSRETHALLVSLKYGVYNSDGETLNNPWEIVKGVPLDDTFVNKKIGVTEIEVEKKWDGVLDGEGKKYEVQMQLYRGGKEYGDLVTLKYNDDPNKSWKHIWTGLDAGYQYDVKEISVFDMSDPTHPTDKSGDYVSTSKIVNDVDNDGKVSIIITNTPKTYGFELTKRNEKGDVLSGAKFQLFRADDPDKTTPLVFTQSKDGYVFDETGANGNQGVNRLSTLGTDKAGKISIYGLPAGTYTLSEIEAPEGYVKVADHTITLGENSGPIVGCEDTECNHDEVTETEITETEETETPNNEYITFKFTLTDKTETTKVEVEKRWEDINTNDVASVTVQLYKVEDPVVAPDGKPYDEAQLNAGNGWQYIWEVPVDIENENVQYYVKEISVTYKDGTVLDGQDLTQEYDIKYDDPVTTAEGTKLTVTNSPKAYSIELTKQDESGTLLSGAKFEIKNDKDSQLKFKKLSDGEYVLDDAGTVTQMVTGNDGKLIISGLPEGVYTLAETEAPQGYEKVVDHTVTLGGTKTGADCKDKDDHTGSVSSTDTHIFTITLTDKEKKYLLPQTGGIGTPIFYILGTVMVLGSGVILVTGKRMKNRKNRNNN